jgi:hypothetical protein
MPAKTSKHRRTLAEFLFTQEVSWQGSYTISVTIYRCKRGPFGRFRISGQRRGKPLSNKAMGLAAS